MFGAKRLAVGAVTIAIALAIPAGAMATSTGVPGQPSQSCEDQPTGPPGFDTPGSSTPRGITPTQTAPPPSRSTTLPASRSACIPDPDGTGARGDTAGYGDPLQIALASIIAKARSCQLPWATLPTSAPMPAVSAIATAPQARTRTVARRRGAPPRRAPMSPSSPSAVSVTTTTAATRADAGVTATASSGSAAPAENYSADAHAA